MPKRPESHRIADVAVNAVEAVFASLGWAVERVEKDYGEDLLVQPAFEHRLEHFRIWIQVKGTSSIERFRDRRGGLTVAVPKSTALRWAASADPVGIVLWDVEHKLGYFGWATDSLDEWQIVSSRRRTAGVSISDEPIFSADYALWLGRGAYLRHYNRRIMETTAMLGQVDSPTELARVKRWVRTQNNLLASDVLIALDIFPEHGGLHGDIYDKLLRWHPPPEEPGLTRPRLCVLLFMQRLKEKWNTPAPWDLIGECSRLIYELYRIEKASKRRRSGRPARSDTSRDTERATRSRRRGH